MERRRRIATASGWVLPPSMPGCCHCVLTLAMARPALKGAGRPGIASLCSDPASGTLISANTMISAHQ